MKEPEFSYCRSCWDKNVLELGSRASDAEYSLQGFEISRAWSVVIIRMKVMKLSKCLRAWRVELITVEVPANETNFSSSLKIRSVPISSCVETSLDFPS